MKDKEKELITEATFLPSQATTYLRSFIARMERVLKNEYKTKGSRTGDLNRLKWDVERFDYYCETALKIRSKYLHSAEKLVDDAKKFYKIAKRLSDKNSSHKVFKVYFYHSHLNAHL